MPILTQACRCGKERVDVSESAFVPWIASKQDVHTLQRCGKFAKLEVGVSYAAVTWPDLTMLRFPRRADPCKN